MSKPVTKKPSTLVNKVVQTTVSTPARRRGRPPKSASAAVPASDPIEALVDTYRKLQAEEKAINEQRKELAEKLKRFLYASGETKYVLQDGSYTVSLKVRPTWTYSDDLTALINRINADKKTEQETGIAQAKESVYIDGRAKA
jgi:hypothetical protein